MVVVGGRSMKNVYAGKLRLRIGTKCGMQVRSDVDVMISDGAGRTRT